MAELMMRAYDASLWCELLEFILCFSENNTIEMVSGLKIHVWICSEQLTRDVRWWNEIYQQRFETVGLQATKPHKLPEHKICDSRK